MLIGVAIARIGFSELWRGGQGLDPRAWLLVIGAGLCSAVSWLAYFAALKLGPAGPVSALDRLSLPIVFVLGVLILGERAGWRGWAGLGLIVAGTALLLADQLRSP